MFDADTTAFLESGCALIVGTAGPDNEPFATRGWGLTVTDAESGELRLLVASNDEVTLERLGAGGRIAITACDVKSLQSLQLKGRAERVETAGELDYARAERFYDDFFGTIEESDGTPRWKTERMIPVGYAACVIVVDESYDQTPGPGAGSSMSGPSA